MSEYVYEYAVPVTYPASQEETFAALSDAAALKVWFAEHVEVEPREGGAYRFWGKHTLGVKSAQQARQKLTRYDPPVSLSFSWRFMDRDSEVAWTVSPDGEKGSKVSIRHEFSSLPEGVRMKEMIDDMWRLHSGNLCFYLMGEKKIYRPDFDDASPVVRHEIVIAAPPAKVFAALITPEHIKQWFPAPAPVVEPKVGGKYGFGYSYEVDGKRVEPPPLTILEYEQDKKLAMTWPDWRGDASVPDQKIEWTLDDLGDGRTRLTLVHSGFVRATDVSDYPFGWVEFVKKLGEVAQSI